MTPAGLCQIFNLTSSVAALGAFVAANKPPQRTLSCLRNSTREIRLLLDEQLATSSWTKVVAHSALRSSQPSAPSPLITPSGLLTSIQAGKVDQAVKEYKWLQSRQAVLEPDLIKELIKGVEAGSIHELAEHLETCHNHNVSQTRNLCSAAKTAEASSSSGCFRHLAARSCATCPSLQYLSVPCHSCHQGVQHCHFAQAEYTLLVSLLGMCALSLATAA